jgi:DNA-binding response OmpR family regulator
MAHILVVDDEEIISDLIIMNLNMVGFTCSQAFNGQEALEAINQVQFDLCLLDVMLPGKDGFQLIDKFKEANIPVIYLTAKNSFTDRVKRRLWRHIFRYGRYL